MLAVSDQELDDKLNLVGDELAMRLGIDAGYREEVARLISQPATAARSNAAPISEVLNGRRLSSASTSG
jgi:hypothetical protein